MPTVILLDNSLSMCKYANQSVGSEGLTNRELSNIMVQRLIDHISKNDKFEYVALVAFSSKAEIISEFTRDYSKITDPLKTLKIGDCACLEEGLNKVSDLVIDEWACFTNIQVLLITDTMDSLHNGSVKTISNRLKSNRVLLKDYYLSNGIDFDEQLHFNAISNEDILKSNMVNKQPYFNLKYPFAFPNKFDVICLSGYECESQNSEDYVQINENCDKKKFLETVSDTNSLFSFDEENFNVKKWQTNRNLKLFYLNELIEINNSTGSLYLTKMFKSKENFNESSLCDQIFNSIFKKYTCKIKCGHLESNATLVPAPLPYKGYENYFYVEKSISRNLDICGFINITELTTPPTISRHLIFANFDQKENSCDSEDSDQKNVDMNNETDTGVVSFLVLLHSSLKSEGMAAIVYLDNDWYGAIHCWQDSKCNDAKKKSNLMLTIFVPGTDVMQNIIIKAGQNVKSQINSTSRVLPIKSYSKGCIVWYRPDNLVSDLQKIIRNAKKMHDKMTVFYKELNKVRRAALSFGFHELFDGLAQMLQRELNNPSNMNNQDMIVQLNHCIFCLRAPEFREYRKDIQPFVGNTIFPRKIQK